MRGISAGAGSDSFSQCLGHHEPNGTLSSEGSVLHRLVPPPWASRGTKNVEHLGHKGYVSPQALILTDTPYSHPHPWAAAFS